LRNIVFLLPQLKTGGGLRVVIELSNHLCKDFNITILAPNTNTTHNFFVDKRVRVEKVGKQALSTPQKIVNILKLYFKIQTQYKDDIIVTTDPIFSLPFLFLRVKYLFRYIQADDYRLYDNYSLIKSPFMLKLYKWLTKRSFKQNITFIFNSDFTYQTFCAIRGEHVAKHIVYPCVDTKIFCPLKSKKEGLNIAYIARKNPHKRFCDFIDAYKLLGLEHPKAAKRIERVYVITHDDIREYPTQDFIVIKPNNDTEIATILQKSDIFVSTSLWEGFGLPGLEAISSGCALISSDSKGVDAYAKDKYNALIYPPTDVIALTNHLEKLLLDDAFREKLIENSSKIREKFIWEKSAKVFKEIINKESI